MKLTLPTLWIVASLALATLGSAQEPAKAQPTRADLAVGAILSSSLSAKPGATARLGRLGGGSAAALFRAVHLRSAWVAGEDEEPPYQVPIDASLVAMAYEALGLIPRTQLRSYLGELKRGTPSLLQRMTAVAVLGEYGEAEDLPLLVQVTPHGEDGKLTPSSLISLFGRAADALLDRHPDAASELETSLSEAVTPLRVELIRRLHDHPSPEALESLARQLGRELTVDPIVMIALQHQGADRRQDAPHWVRRRVRQYLDHTDKNLSREAIRCVAALDDVDATSKLIGLLDTGPERARRDAWSSLRLITGQRMSRRCIEWETWYQDEERWQADRLESALIELTSPDPSQVSAAVLELSRRRVYRAQILPALVELTSHDNPELVRIACAALGGLGSWSAVPPLRQLLNHPDRGVQAQVRSSLTRLAFTEGHQAPSVPNASTPTPR